MAFGTAGEIGLQELWLVRDGIGKRLQPDTRRQRADIGVVRREPAVGEYQAMARVIEIPRRDPVEIGRWAGLRIGECRASHAP